MRTIPTPLATLASALLLVGSASAQLSTRIIDVSGVTRDYLMYLPIGYDGVTELPVLFVFHGGAMDAPSMLLMTDMRPLADANDFILVYPQGLPDAAGDRIWNSEGPFSNGVDEIGFTDAMIDDLHAQFAVDQQRIYACGYSNGANLVWELGCFLSDRIAAVGAVAGSMWTWTEVLCTPSRPVPVLSIHGTFDFFNPYQGGPPFSLGLIEASEYWALHAGANLTPMVVDVPDIAPGDGSTVSHYTWAGGDDCVSIEHFKVSGGGHDWPGAFGNMDIDSNVVIWEFVSQYDLQGKIDCCSVIQIGVGVGGANIASLDSNSIPTLGSTMQLDFSGFQGNASGSLILSPQNATQQVLGGTLFPDLNALAGLLPVTSAADGSGSVSVPLGTNPALVGKTGYAQIALPDATQVAGWAFSNGLAVTICD